MKFRKGDSVSFLNEKGGGVVNRVDEKGYVYVLTTDGFEIPVAEKELVFAGTFLNEREEPEPPRKQEPSASPVKFKPKADQGPVLPRDIISPAEVNVLLGFIPEYEGPVFNNNIGCFLINDSPYLLYYQAGKKEGGQLHNIASGFIEADTKTRLTGMDQTSLSKISDIHVQCIFASSGRYNRRAPLDAMVNLNLVNFSKESYYRVNDYFEERAVLFELSGKRELSEDMFDIPEEVMDLKSHADRIEKPKQKEPAPDTLEVDLHYDGEGLANSQLSPQAILALQMSRFHSAVEEAISKNIRRLVVIHGIGQGTLKMQIRKEIQEKYPGFVFQDASFKEYGFGATMVHLITEKRQ